MASIKCPDGIETNSIVSSNNTNLNLVGTGTGQIGFNGNYIVNTNSLLGSTYFPDTVNTFAWHNNGLADFDGTNWIGGQNFTENGTGLTASTNHLGAVAYSKFNGTDDYLSNTDATFDTSDEDFTFYAWIRADAIADNKMIASKCEVNGGKISWQFFMDDIHIYFGVSYNGTNQVALVGPSRDILGDLQYHFVAITYNYVSANESWMLMMVDGNVVGYQKNSTAGQGSRYNSSDSELKIGARSNGGAEQFWAGDITEIGYKKTVLSPNELRKIYAAGCKKFVTIDGNNKIAIIDGRKSNGEYYIYPAASFTVTATAVGTAATGYQLYIPETGKYRVKAQLALEVADTAASATVDRIYTRLTGGSSGTTEIPGAYTGIILDLTTSGGITNAPSPLMLVLSNEIIVYASVNDIINVEAWKDAGTNEAQLYYSGNVFEPYLMWEKLD